MPARYFMAAAHEQLPPGALLDQAAAAERAGFGGVCCSGHFQPWWEPGESGQAWAWPGAMAERTLDVALDTAVTAPVQRYHPALVAQFGPRTAAIAGRRGRRAVDARRSSDGPGSLDAHRAAADDAGRSPAPLNGEPAHPCLGAGRHAAANRPPMTGRTDP